MSSGRKKIARMGGEGGMGHGHIHLVSMKAKIYNQL